MGLSKKSKIWITIAVTPVVILLILILALKIYLTSDRLAALIIPQIERVTNRTVSISSISFSVFPSLSISIDNLALSNPRDGNFQGDKFIAVKNLRLKVNIFSLLKEKLQINYIIIENPSVYLEVAPDGKSNYTFQMEQPPGDGKAVQSETAQTSSAGAFLLSNMDIIDGKVEYYDREGGNRVVLEGLQQRISAELEGGSGLVSITGTTYISKFSAGSSLFWYLVEQPLSLSLRAVYDQDQDMMKIQDASVKLNEIPFTAGGSIAGIGKSTMQMDITIGSDNAEMSQLLALIPQDFLQAAKGLTSSGKVAFTAVIKGQHDDSLMPGVKVSFKISGGKVQYTSLPKAVTGIEVEGSFELPPGARGETEKGLFTINTFQAGVGGSNIHGKLRSSNFNDPDILLTLTGQMDLGEVKDFYPLDEGTELRGQLLADISIQGKAKFPQNMKAEGSAEFKEVFIKNKTNPVPLRDLSGTVRFNNTRIESKRIDVKVGESDLNTSFVIRNFLGLVLEDARKAAGIPSASINLSSDILRVTDLMGKEPEKQQGKNTSQDRETQSVLLPPLNVDANINVKKLITDKFEFTDAVGKIVIADGIASLNNFSVNAFGGRVQTKGTLDLRKPENRPFSFDLKVTGVEANAMLSRFTSFGSNLSGQFNMTSSLKGELDDTLGIDRKSLVGNGSVRVANGKLVGFPLTAKLAEFTGVSELREISFRDWANTFSIADGRVEIKDLIINAGTTDFLVNGTHGLDGTMDYALTVKLPQTVSDRLKLPGVGAELLKFFKDSENRINLNFMVAGETGDPRLSLNTKSQEEMAKKALEDAAKKKLEEELKKKAQDGIKKLFKKF